jgi:hypothetical protein
MATGLAADHRSHTMSTTRSRSFVPTRTRTLTALTGLLALVIGLLSNATPLAASAGTPYGTNLVKNAGAQDGLHHWQTFPPSDFKTHAYGPGGSGFPSRSTSRAIHGGTRFFYAGLYDSGYGTCGDAQQQWKLKGLGGAVDGGHVKVKLKGYAGTNDSPLITAHVDLYFRDAQNHSVAKNGITRAVSGTNGQYQSTAGASVLPRHSRILRLHLWADGDATVTSGDCQAFWDNLSVVLKHI